MIRAMLICAVVSSLAGCSIRVVPVAAPHLHFAKRADSSKSREQFDPAPYSQDLLLIQPKFAPPVVEGPGDDSPTDIDDVRPLESHRDRAEPVLNSPRVIYRVQVIALRDSTSAYQLAGQLRELVPHGVEVILKNRLHMVRAGRFDNSDAAKRLKGEVKALGGDFSEAYVVTELQLAGGPRTPQAHVAPVPQPTTLDPDIPLEDSPVADSPFLDEEEVPEPALPEPVLVHMSGWRVLIKQLRNYPEAKRELNLARTRLGRNDIDIKLEGPLNKVLVGNYRTENEAKRAAESIKRWYPNAFKVRAMVYLPSDR